MSDKQPFFGLFFVFVRDKYSVFLSDGMGAGPVFLTDGRKNPEKQKRPQEITCGLLLSVRFSAPLVDDIDPPAGGGSAKNGPAQQAELLACGVVQPQFEHRAHELLGEGCGVDLRE